MCDPIARVVKWQTRAFKGRMPKGMRVRVPPRAPLFPAIAGEVKSGNKHLGRCAKRRVGTRLCCPRPPRGAPYRLLFAQAIPSITMDWYCHRRAKGRVVRGSAEPRMSDPGGSADKDCNKVAARSIQGRHRLPGGKCRQKKYERDALGSAVADLLTCYFPTTITSTG